MYTYYRIITFISSIYTIFICHLCFNKVGKNMRRGPYRFKIYKFLPETKCELMSRPYPGHFSLISLSFYWALNSPFPLSHRYLLHSTPTSLLPHPDNTFVPHSLLISTPECSLVSWTSPFEGLKQFKPNMDVFFSVDTFHIEVP